MTTDDLFRALGEKTAEAYMLARRVAELERQLAVAQAQVMQQAQAVRESNGQTPEPGVESGVGTYGQNEAKPFA